MCDKEESRVREQAINRVLEVRGSYDAPGFETCVEQEIANIKAREEALDELVRLGQENEDYYDYNNFPFYP